VHSQIKRDSGAATTKDQEEHQMANSVYRVIEVVGTSTQSWEDAAKTAVETASGSLRDLRVAEVTRLDVTVEDGKVSSFRTRLNLSFKYETA
jgi:flavin-binding protein dodecin